MESTNRHFQLRSKGCQSRDSVLSRISRLFDPFGLATVATIRARIALQKIWKKKKYDWDDPLPEEMSSLWNKLFKYIESINIVEIPRCLKPKGASGPPELHVFADASIVTYGAAASLSALANKRRSTSKPNRFKGKSRPSTPDNDPAT